MYETNKNMVRFHASKDLWFKVRSGVRQGNIVTPPFNSGNRTSSQDGGKLFP